jgi:hypothetical protein
VQSWNSLSGERIEATKGRSPHTSKGIPCRTGHQIKLGHHIPRAGGGKGFKAESMSGKEKLSLVHRTWPPDTRTWTETTSQAKANLNRQGPTGGALGALAAGGTWGWQATGRKIMSKERRQNKIWTKLRTETTPSSGQHESTGVGNNRCWDRRGSGYRRKKKIYFSNDLYTARMIVWLGTINISELRDHYIKINQLSTWYKLSFM